MTETARIETDTDRAETGMVLLMTVNYMVLNITFRTNIVKVSLSASAKVTTLFKSGLKI